MTARLLAAFRAGPGQDEQRPLYARILRLRHVEPGKVLCALYFEGSIVLAMLLAFADLVSWWGVLATPATVAAMVKVNDVVAGRLPDPHAARRPRARSEVPSFDVAVVVGYGGPAAPEEEPDTAVLGIIRVDPAVSEADGDVTVPLQPLPELPPAHLSAPDSDDPPSGEAGPDRR